MSVIAHVDHGKSTLTDSLVAAAGIIAMEQVCRRSAHHQHLAIGGVQLQSQLKVQPMNETGDSLSQRARGRCSSPSRPLDVQLCPTRFITASLAHQPRYQGAALSYFHGVYCNRT